MPGSGRKHILKAVDGKEYGPVDQDALVRWAESGRVTAYCQVRSTLLKRWELARDVSFLRDIIAAQEPEEEEPETGVWERLRERATRRAVKSKLTSGLQEPKAADYRLASAVVRILAGLTDAVILVLYMISVYLAMALLYSRGFPADFCFYTGLVIAHVGTLLYFAWSIGFHAHTLGQKTWGILVIQKEGHDLSLGRAYVFSICMLLCTVLTPFVMFIAPSGCALQDLISGTRVVKARIVVASR